MYVTLISLRSVTEFSESYFILKHLLLSILLIWDILSHFNDDFELGPPENVKNNEHCVITFQYTSNMVQSLKMRTKLKFQAQQLKKYAYTLYIHTYL